MQIGVRRCRLLTGSFFWMIQFSEWCMFVAPSLGYAQFGTPGNTWKFTHHA